MQHNSSQVLVWNLLCAKPRMELQWSRVELTASCYRVCENAGTLAVQVMRSGNSVDPAYVGIQVNINSSTKVWRKKECKSKWFTLFQVEDGTAKVGKDFTHSSASLIQFDPGVLNFMLRYMTVQCIVCTV